MLLASVCTFCKQAFIAYKLHKLPTECPRCGGKLVSIQPDHFDKKFEEAFYSLNLNPLDTDAQYFAHLAREEDDELIKLISDTKTPAQFVERLHKIE